MNKLAIYFAVLIAASSSLFAQKRNIAEKDLFDFVWIGDPQISPDGMRVAFVRVTVNEKKEGYNTSIWSVPVAGGEEPHQLTKGDHDLAPRWSPDGKFLLFLRASEKEGKPESPQLSILPMAGGDSFSFTDLPKGASNPVWAPDGKTIAFTSDTNAEDVAKQEKKKQKEEELKKPARETSPSPHATAESSAKPQAIAKSKGGAAKETEAEAEHESDIHVITRAIYREDNEGYLDPKHPQHIWVVTVPHSADEKVQPRQLTSGRFDEGNIVWSKDGTQMQKHVSSFDFILDTVSAEHDLNTYINLLKRDGTMTVVGAPPTPPQVQTFGLLMKRRQLAGSAIGGIRETQEMLDFCAERGITADVEKIPIQQVNEAYERVLKGDVKYRFVIDMASLK